MSTIHASESNYSSNAFNLWAIRHFRCLTIIEMTQQVPCIPSTAPFSQEQRAWLNGFLVGLFADANFGATVPASLPAPKVSLPILFGSQTGSAEQLAKRFSKEASQIGFAPRVLELNSFKQIDFAREKIVLIITSTWGDGDPPDNALEFWNFLNSTNVPDLKHLQFGVLALGDKNYSSFCGAGKKMDERLETLGAKRLVERADCDVDYEADAVAWIGRFWPKARLLAPSNLTPSDSKKIADQPAAASAAEKQPRFHKNNPYPARMVACRILNKPGSAKETRHVEIELTGSDLQYEPGDAIGVFPRNCKVHVRELLGSLGFTGSEPVKVNGADAILQTALETHLQIHQLSSGLLQFWSDRSGSSELKELLTPEKKADLDKFLYGRDILDLAQRYPIKGLSAQEFADQLRKLQPRLYSISSSPKAHPGQVHLTVGVVRYDVDGRWRKGVCSNFLTELSDPEARVPVYIQVSHGFRLPTDPSIPVIMIGPGTGIAPFRAFLYERRADQAPGKNWLFFGDQQRACDFLYEEQLLQFQQEGYLNRLDLAFSRDQKEKTYVQHRMLENSALFWEWLQNGAYVYVCGDAKRMARDVDNALRKLIRKEGGKTAEEAVEYVSALKTAKRYQRDVY